MRYIPTNLNFVDIMTKTLVPKKHKESVELIVNAKDAYRIVTARREMADETYEASYFIIQLVDDSDGLYSRTRHKDANSGPLYISRSCLCTLWSEQKRLVETQMRLRRGIGTWQLSLVREKFEISFYRSGVLFSSKIEGIISGEKRSTKRLAG